MPSVKTVRVGQIGQYVIDTVKNREEQGKHTNKVHICQDDYLRLSSECGFMPDTYSEVGLVVMWGKIRTQSWL